MLLHKILISSESSFRLILFSDSCLMVRVLARSIPFFGGSPWSLPSGRIGEELLRWYVTWLLTTNGGRRAKSYVSGRAVQVYIPKYDVYMYTNYICTSLNKYIRKYISCIFMYSICTICTHLSFNRSDIHTWTYRKGVSWSRNLMVTCREPHPNANMVEYHILKKVQTHMVQWVYHVVAARILNLGMVSIMLPGSSPWFW